MNNGWRKWAWLALFCCWASSVAVRAETVRIAVGEWPPYISEALPNQGFLCEVVRQAFAEEGLDVSFHFYSWAEAYRLTLEGRYVVTMPWFRSREREQLFYLSASLGHFTTRLMTLTGTPAVNLGELKHEPVGVTRGYFYGDGFAARQAGLTLEWSDSDEESMGKLLDGRIHYLVMDEQVAQTLFQQALVRHPQSLSLTGAADPIWSQPGYLLMRKADPEARRLMLLFNTGLRKLERSGRLARLWKARATVASCGLAPYPEPFAVSSEEAGVLTWSDVIGSEKEQDYFKSTLATVRAEREAGKVIYPPATDVFNAFKLTELDQVKVVILGQDPYHGPNQAHGLCFSVLPGVRTPPSLVNIYKEMQRDLPGFVTPNHGFLESWAKQGVLLLNTVLTVQAGQAHSHAHLGWETFTDRVIEQINASCQGVVFLLWGAHAQKKGRFIDRQRHYVLTAPHPSPLSAHRGFIGCGHFSETNRLLEQQGKSPIEWKSVCIPLD